MGGKFKALKCRIFSGAFSGERVFKADLGNGCVHESMAYVGYFFDSSGRPLDFHEPRPGKFVDGLVLARVLKSRASSADLELPDGEVVVAPLTFLHQVSARNTMNVPV